MNRRNFVKCLSMISILPVIYVRDILNGEENKRRMSVDKDDIGYSPEAKNHIPYLNGKKVKHCITADEKQGYVLVYITDPNDDYIFNATKTALLKKKLYGKVTIRRL
jgi:hypothetical protein